LIPRVCIRADGSSLKGLGHLVRCKALADMLSDEFEIVFFCKEIPLFIENEFRKYGYLIINLETENDFFGLIKEDDVVVLDGYEFNIYYQKKVKAKGSKLVFIDDLHNKKFYCDLIINHAPSVNILDYKVLSQSEYALGPDFALLRKPFLEAARKKRKVDSIKRLFICFGGSDPLNFTHKALKAAIEFIEFTHITVIAGPGYKMIDSLLEIKNTDLRVIIIKNATENEMYDFMTKADLAIVPSSGILYEVLAVGCLVISGFFVDNQKKIYDGFYELGAIIPADNFTNLKYQIQSAFSLENRFDNSQVIDGFSNLRILDRFKSLTI